MATLQNQDHVMGTYCLSYNGTQLEVKKKKPNRQSHSSVTLDGSAITARINIMCLYCAGFWLSLTPESPEKHHLLACMSSVYFYFFLLLLQDAFSYTAIPKSQSSLGVRGKKTREPGSFENKWRQELSGPAGMPHRVHSKKGNTPLSVPRSSQMSLFLFVSFARVLCPFPVRCSPPLPPCRPSLLIIIL